MQKLCVKIQLVMIIASLIVLLYLGVIRVSNTTFSIYQYIAGAKEEAQGLSQNVTYEYLKGSFYGVIPLILSIIMLIIGVIDLIYPKNITKYISLGIAILSIVAIVLCSLFTLPMLANYGSECEYAFSIGRNAYLSMGSILYIIFNSLILILFLFVTFIPKIYHR